MRKFKRWNVCQYGGEEELKQESKIDIPETET